MHLFDNGWNKLRETIFANQKTRRHPADSASYPWPDLQNWDPLDGLREENLHPASGCLCRLSRLYRRRDWPGGSACRGLGNLDNTLIIYITAITDRLRKAHYRHAFRHGDVHGSEVPVEAQLKFYDIWGTEFTDNYMAVRGPGPSIRCSSGPSRFGPHFGGTRQGMAIAWPKSSLTKAAFATSPPTSSTSLRPSWRRRESANPRSLTALRTARWRIEPQLHFHRSNADEPSHHVTQYFEMFGNNAIYHEGWMLVDKANRPAWVTAGP